MVNGSGTSEKGFQPGVGSWLMANKEHHKSGLDNSEGKDQLDGEGGKGEGSKDGEHPDHMVAKGESRGD